ncbi:Spy/CpxP family protein refolding chaperone [Pontiellaceae bacterium B1224]|nr:Spy/CpxP family protein refolding chaperone [Pontiellaceae bacterium B1224]
MKSAYELAMERSTGPALKLTDEQKAALTEIDSKMKAKVAETEIMFDQQLAAETDPAKAGLIQQTRQQQIAKIKENAEDEKERVRRG